MDSIGELVDDGSPASGGPQGADRRRTEFLAPFAGLLAQVRYAKNNDMYALFRELEVGDKPGWVLSNGVPAVSLVANDYLALGTDPRVVAAAAESLTEFGTSRCASPLAGGYTPLHRHLEERLAEFVQQETAVVLASGYQANLGAVAGLMQAGDLVVCDLLCHASIVDGARLAGAEVRYFQHNNARHLEAVLGAAASGRRVLVAVEGVYSADGDCTPLPDICRAAQRHGALVMLDEAHSLGVFGSDGGGMAVFHGLADQVDLIVGTLSKSVGMVGGFIAGGRQLVDVIRHNGRALIFSAALPPVMAGGAARALEIMRTEPARRERLWNNALHLRSSLHERGFDTLNSRTPVLPVLVGDPERTLVLSSRLARAGVLVCPAIPPMVQPHMSRIRMHVTAGHDRTAIDHAVQAIDEVSEQVGVPRLAGAGQ